MFLHHLFKQTLNLAENASEENRFYMNKLCLLSGLYAFSKYESSTLYSAKANYSEKFSLHIVVPKQYNMQKIISAHSHMGKLFW